jgi:hypothetical protein
MPLPAEIEMRPLPALLVAFVLVAPSAMAQIKEANGDAVAAGRTLRTGAGSHIAFRLDQGALDLAGGTRLDVVAATPDNLELALPQGRIRLDLQRLEPGQNVAIDLPQGGLWLRQPGEYDIAAGSSQEPSRVAVLSGLAHFTGRDIDTDIKTGEAAVLTGVNPVIPRFEGATADGFDAWAREQQISPPRPVEARQPPEPRERSVERRTEHRRYVRRYWRRGYTAYGAFNPLQPLFSLFRAL